MGSKKRPSSSVVQFESEDDAPADAVTLKPSEESLKDNATEAALKPMERRKRRKALDKERHQPDLETMEQSISKKSSSESGEVAKIPLTPSSSTGLPAFHVNVFGNLSSPDSSVREAAAEALVFELRNVQKAYEKLEKKGGDMGGVQLEAEKDDGLENCAPSLRYAVRRLIRGVSSSRECARQGFALGLTVVIGTIPAIKVDPLLKLIVGLLEVSSSMKGQEARDCLLGRLFAYGSLARSGRVTSEWISDNSSSSVTNFISHVISLADKKRYLREPAVSVILDMVEKLPLDGLLSQVLGAPCMKAWFEKAAENGDPDVLFLALKLQERVPMDSDRGMVFAKLLPYPFSFNNFFTRDHLLTLAPCFKESTFCTPRVHSLWTLLVNALVQDMAPPDEDASARSTSLKKHKKSRRSSSFEEITKNIRCFCEVVIEESLLQSSHDRKHLAFNVLLLLLARLPASFIQIFLSHKLVNCLIDVLSTEGSWLYSAAQFYLKELLKWAGDDDNRCVGVIIALQKHSNGRFDYITRTQSVKELVAKFNTSQSCMLFVDQLMSLFVDEGNLTDEPSDQSQTTDENSDIGSMENKDFPVTLENMDFLKVWVIDTMPRILKNIKLGSNAEEVNPLDAKFRVQTKIMKFLAVQGLFSASLGTEVTSLELHETFKWPKAASSSSLRRMCIEQLQSLLEDAERGEGSNVVLDGLELNDLGSYFMRILNILYNFPSVSLYRSLDNEDEKAFKKLQAMESRLSHKERNFGSGDEANKLHALRYLLIQLLLQVLLHPGEFSEAASELVICCMKAFSTSALNDSSAEEDEFDDNDTPKLMDVLVDTLLSLLPQSSGAMRFAVEQVFRFFSKEITFDGLLQMLRIVKKDLKRARHQATNSDDDTDDDEDDLLGIEESEETDEVEAAETADSDDHTYVPEGMDGTVATEVEPDGEDEEVSLGVEETDEEATVNGGNLSASDDSDGGMDDDAMFRIESHLARLFKERKISSGHDNANSQLVPFKLRVLSLLEIYLQGNIGNPHVLMISSYLAQAFVRAHVAEGSQQLGQRIGGILQKKIFKAKEYPKGDDIQFSTLETQLEKSLRSASGSRRKEVSSLAQAYTFWILKIIQARDLPKSELNRVVEIFQHTLLVYFTNKKCRLKSGFVKEVVRRYPWLGSQLFGFLLKKSGSVESEFRRIEALDLVDCIMRSWIPTRRGDNVGDASSKLPRPKLLKKSLPVICELIQQLLSKLPKKQSRRAQVRRFCTTALLAVSVFNLKKYFLNASSPDDATASSPDDAYSACQSQLKAAFRPVQMPRKSKEIRGDVIEN